MSVEPTNQTSARNSVARAQKPRGRDSRAATRVRLSRDMRKTEILKAAYETFAEVGYSAARIQDIAARAGTTKGLVLFYFARKEDLFEAVVEKALPPLVRQTDHLLDQTRGSCAYRLTEMLRMLHAGLVDRPEFGAILRILVAEGRTFPALVEAYYKNIIRTSGQNLAAIVERGIAAGEFRKIDTEQAPRLLLSPMVMAIFWNNLFAHLQPLDTDALLRSQIDIVIAGLKAKN